MDCVLKDPIATLNVLKGSLRASRHVPKAGFARRAAKPQESVCARDAGAVSQYPPHGHDRSPEHRWLQR